MKASRLAKRVLGRRAEARVKTAAFPPPPPPGVEGPGKFPGGGEEKAGGQRRNIPTDHAFDPKALKPMAKALWASSVSLGHALTAYRYLNRLKSATVSPDGMVGGRGYIMKVAELRERLYDACEALSAISDTLHDEIQAPHWKPRLAMLDTNEREDVNRFVEESQTVLDDPTEESESRIEDIDTENDDEGSEADDEEDMQLGVEEDSSSLPNGGPGEVSESETKKPSKPALKEARNKRASLVPYDRLPGPRVTELGPGVGTGPGGSFNPKEDATGDDWGLDQNDPEYLRWDDLRSAADAWAQSTLPSDPSPSTGYDYGLGYGARGEGVTGPGPDTMEHSIVPGDTQPPVARSPYYDGDKGNDVRADSVLPGDSTTAPTDTDKDVPGESYVHQDAASPFARLEHYNYDRDPPHQEGL